MKIPNTGYQKNQQIQRESVPVIIAVSALCLGFCIKNAESGYFKNVFIKTEPMQ